MASIVFQRNNRGTAVLLTVKLGFLRQDDFFAENVDDIQATTDQGILKVVLRNGEQIDMVRTYNPKTWKSITSRRVASRARV